VPAFRLVRLLRPTVPSSTGRLRPDRPDDVVPAQVSGPDAGHLHPDRTAAVESHSSWSRSSEGGQRRKPASIGPQQHQPGRASGSLRRQSSRHGPALGLWPQKGWAPTQKGCAQGLALPPGVVLQHSDRWRPVHQRDQCRYFGARATRRALSQANSVAATPHRNTRDQDVAVIDDHPARRRAPPASCTKATRRDAHAITPR
jgi:hypothetical protein